MKTDWQALMRDWEETERQLKALPENADERPHLQQRLDELQRSIDSFVNEHQKQRRPVAGQLIAAAIRPTR